MKENNKIINQILEVTSARYPDSEIYLYGSHARGDAKRTADWDVLILLNADHIPFEVETNLMDAFYDLELETGEVISPMIYSKSDWNNNQVWTPLYENVQKEGVRLK